jgi:hypothetical protein
LFHFSDRLSKENERIPTFPVRNFRAAGFRLS